MHRETGNLLSRSVKNFIRGSIRVPLLGPSACWLMRHSLQIIFALNRRPSRIFCYRWRGVIREFPEIFQGMAPYEWVVPITKHFSMKLGYTDEIELWLLNQGKWDQHVADYITQSLKPGDIFVDVGAHIGYHTLTAAVAVGSQGSIFSFEPNPATHKKLLTNIHLSHFKNIIVSPVGIGTTSGMQTFYPGPANNVGASSFCDYGNTPTSIKVMVQPFDAVITEEGIRPSLVKIDVEAFELEVLKSMPSLLARGGVELICELSGRLASGRDDNPRRVITYMLEQGYTAYILHPDGQVDRVPVQPESEVLDLEEHIDVVFKSEHV